MIPLRLSWAWTIWKAQGQSMRGAVAVHLGDKEMTEGLMYTAITRVIRAVDLGFADGITMDRIGNAISSSRHLKLRLKEEERLDELHLQLQDQLRVATIEQVLESRN